MRIAKLALLLVFAALILIAPAALAARHAEPVILVDLSHGQNVRGLCLFMKTLPEAYWVILVPTADYKLPPCTIKPYKVVVGNFASKEVVEVLREVDVVVIGQPTKSFSEDELKVLAEWFKAEPGRVLWCAGDSDYPAQGGSMEIAQHACDTVLEAIGSKLRLDFVSVEDTKSNAGRPYRVVGIVKPDPRYSAEIIAYGAHKVLFHGPGAVAWVDEKGKWHKLTEPGTPENLIKIVVTTENGRIVEHQPKAPGQPGEFGRAHKVGETGVFVLMAAEVIGEKPPYSVVIVSGESPYGGYQPMVSFRYHGVQLDGPRFVRNLLLWALGYPAELGIVKGLEEIIAEKIKPEIESLKGEVSSKLAKVPDLEKSVSSISSELTSIKKEIESLKGKVGGIDKVKSKVDELSSKLDEIKKKVDDLEASLSGYSGLVYAAVALAIIAMALGGFALALARKRPAS